MAIAKKTLGGRPSNTNNPRASVFKPNERGGASLKDESELSVREQCNDNFKDIFLSKIKPRKSNKFRKLNTRALEKSIEFTRLINPITVKQLYEIRKNGDEEIRIPTGEYEIVAGERRYTAYCNLFQKAQEENNKNNIERYEKIKCLILPLGATDEEIQAIYADTNFLARPITIDEVFANFDAILDSNEMPKDVANKAKYVKEQLKDIGFDWGLTKIKEYLAIYGEPDKRIRKYIDENKLSKKDAYFITNLDNNEKSNLLTQFEELSANKILKVVKTERANKKKKKIKEVSEKELVKLLDDIKVNLIPYNGNVSFVLNNKENIIKQIDMIQNTLDKIKNNI